MKCTSSFLVVATALAAPLFETTLCTDEAMQQSITGSVQPGKQCEFPCTLSASCAVGSGSVSPASRTS